MSTSYNTAQQKPISAGKINRLKKDAKVLKKQKQREGDRGFKQSKALDHIARDNGYPNWKAVLQAKQTVPLIQSQRALPFSKPDTKTNEKTLIKNGVEFSVFEVTETGLKKSILDATQPVRSHLQQEAFHDYEKQGQGPGHKVMKQAFLVSPEGAVSSQVSLYRPKTKQGDPRMWFQGLKAFVEPDDQVAIVIHDGDAYLFNLSQHNLAVSCEGSDAIGLFLARHKRTKETVAEELLGKLKELAKAPIPALGKGDTAIGMAIEAALGIPANCSKKPDYKGIELKAGRGTKNRSTLFAQVADWKKSECKSSREIVEEYGYERDGDLKLYCTISTQKTNSQGLSFEYNSEADELTEKHESGTGVATWTGKVLRDRLLEKHRETFWIQARSEMIDGIEHFHLERVTHTHSPILTQLMPLLDEGVITMDHLIKKKGENARVSEKGPLFKIDKHNLPLLFPDPATYKLA